MLVQPTETVAIATADLEPLPPNARLAEARRRASRDAATPFDLEVGPPVRATLLRLGPDEHVWLLTMHHIACDGWSLNIVWRELAAWYTALAAGQEPVLPPLPVSYAEHATAEQQRERDGAFDKHLDYWRRQLSGSAPLALPTDHPYPPFPSSRGARLSRPLPDGLTSALRRFSRENSVTPFMTFLAAFQVLLARHCGQRDITVGLPVDGRGRAEIESLVGFFVNTVVLRADVAPRKPFRELLTQARATVLDAIDHQEVPFGRLITGLRPPRDPARPPLFQAMIAVEDPATIPAIPGLRIERLPVERATAQVELSLSLDTAAPETTTSLEYATDLFTPETAGRMLGHYRVLLAGVLADPDRPVGRLPLLTSDERRWLAAAGRGPRPEPAPATNLPEFVARQDPAALAVLAGTRRLTFADLADAAARLTGRLGELGVQPGDAVGLIAGRDADLVVGMLGVLGAGAICVPLSPTLPTARLTRVLDHSEIRIVVGHEEAAGRTVVPVAQHGPAGRLATPASDAVAFTLYTSGSTGEPKAVPMTHGALASLFTNMVVGHGIAPGDRVLSFSGLGTDMCVEDIFLALCGGAAVVFPDGTGDVVDTAAGFFAACERLGVTVVNVATAYWHELALGLTDASMVPSRLRLVLTGGDRAAPALFRRWLERAGDRVRLINAYGPTETTINATQHVLAGVEDIGREVPIGRPLPGVDVYVLDESLELVPVGVTGELCVGGPRVVPGYRGRPDLTAGRFVPDPYGAPGGRLYRTGDLVRWRPDGVLEFVGRADGQVKVRGFRVEPGEVETVLAGHAEVDNAVVVGRRASSGDTHLVAYVVSTVDPGELRAHLAERLPDYMVPAVLVPLAELPRTVSGKVDRAALPEPALAGPAGTAPRTPLERTLAELWADVLGLGAVGVHDDFFDLGGHSLQTVRLATRISAAVGVDVPVRLVLRHPTVAELAAALAAQPTEPAVPTPVPASTPRRQGDDDFVGFSHRPLLTMIESGDLPPVDAATLSLVPETLLAQRNLTAEEYIEDWCQGVPLLSGIKDSALGRIALMMLPFPESRAYTDPDGVVATAISGLRLAGRVGATVVSLINLLPSATDYGHTIQDAVAGQDLPRLTTGHATTTAAVVLNVERTCRLTGRPLAGEDLAVIGLGSIGLSTLRLLLRRLPHPRRILLCDLYSRRAHLDEVRAEVEAIYAGPVEVAEADKDAVPDEVYGASLIVAATNVPDVLDVDRLAPGRIVIDDSAPHCFDPARALRRWHSEADVLCVEGGGVRSPDPITESRYLPSWVARRREQAEVRDWFEPDRHNIGGCVMSALLAARFPEIPVTVGLTGVDAGEANLNLLHRLGFTAADPLLENELLDSGRIATFRAAHGGT